MVSCAIHHLCVAEQKPYDCVHSARMGLKDRYARHPVGQLDLADPSNSLCGMISEMCTIWDGSLEESRHR
jgi:hypothetical protein